MKRLLFLIFLLIALNNSRLLGAPPDSVENEIRLKFRAGTSLFSSGFTNHRIEGLTHLHTRVDNHIHFGMLPALEVGVVVEFGRVEIRSDFQGTLSRSGEVQFKRADKNLIQPVSQSLRKLEVGLTYKVHPNVGVGLVMTNRMADITAHSSHESAILYESSNRVTAFALSVPVLFRTHDSRFTYYGNVSLAPWSISSEFRYLSLFTLYQNDAVNPDPIANQNRGELFRNKNVQAISTEAGIATAFGRFPAEIEIFVNYDRSKGLFANTTYGLSIAIGFPK